MFLVTRTLAAFLVLAAIASAETSTAMLAVSSRGDGAVNLYSVLAGGLSVETAKYIPAGKRPGEMCLAPDGKLLALTMINDDSVQFFKADTLEAKQQVAAVRSPQHMAFSPDSKRLYVVGKINDEVGIIGIGQLARLTDMIPITRGLAHGEPRQAQEAASPRATLPQLRRV